MVVHNRRTLGVVVVICIHTACGGCSDEMKWMVDCEFGCRDGGENHKCIRSCAECTQYQKMVQISFALVAKAVTTWAVSCDPS